MQCGRCRKRKIRCTGDSGAGQPCQNCKNAGFEPCQFLRVWNRTRLSISKWVKSRTVRALKLMNIFSQVASQEAPMKADSFSYNIEASRQYQARASSSMFPTIPPSMQPYSEVMHIPGGEAMSYRTSLAYHLNGKPYIPVSNWAGGYPDEGAIDYSAYQQPYQTLSESNYMMGYRVGTNSAASGKLLESETGYSYGNVQAAPSLVHRPASAVDHSNFSFHNVAGGLSNSLSGNERMLPSTSCRPMTSSSQSPYRHDSVSSGYSKTPRQSHGEASSSALSEVPDSYSAYESPSMGSYSATAMACQTSRHNDYYTTSTSDSAHSSTDDSTYKYTDTTRRVTGAYSAGICMSNGQSYLSPQNHGSHTPYMVATDSSANTGASEQSKGSRTLRS